MADAETGQRRLSDSECNLIYDAYVRRLYAFLCKRFGCDGVHHQECIRSGIHEAFFELFSHADAFEVDRASGKDPLFNYLVGMATRRVIDCLRTESRRQQAAGPSLDDGNADEWLGPAGPTDQHLNDLIEDFVEQRIGVAEFAARMLIHEVEPVLDGLDRLNDEQQAIWFLRHTARLTVREIADLLGRREDAVESSLRATRRILLNGQAGH